MARPPFISGHWKGNDKGISFWQLPDDKNPQLIIISADFSIKDFHDCDDPFCWIGQGKVYDDRLEELVNVAKEYNDNTPVILVLHFAPGEQIRTDKIIPSPLRLNDYEKLIKKAELADIEYIFCGHIHENIPYSLGINKKISVFCAGSSTCIEPNIPPSISVIEIKLEAKNIDRVRVQPLFWNGETFSRP